MTHDELLAKLDIEKANRYMPIDETTNDDWLHIESVFNALRAVVELQTPVEVVFAGEPRFKDSVEFAKGYEYAMQRVIQAIEKELK